MTPIGRFDRCSSILSISLYGAVCLGGIGVTGLWKTDECEITEVSTALGVEAADPFCILLAAFLADRTCGLESSQPDVPSLSHLEQGAVPDVVCPITALPWSSRSEDIDDSSGSADAELFPTEPNEIGLNLAIERGQEELITLLLEHGANPYIVSERTHLDAFGVWLQMGSVNGLIVLYTFAVKR